MSNANNQSKSPLTLSILIAVLVISTLMMLSHYFLRPSLELDLKHKIVKSLDKYNVFNAMVMVEGRNVTLTGVAENNKEAEMVESEIRNISGIHQVDSKLLIKNQTIE